MKLADFYEDPSILHVNTTDNRAYYIPYETPEGAMEKPREESGRFTDVYKRQEKHGFGFILPFPKGKVYSVSLKFLPLSVRIAAEKIMKIPVQKHKGMV